MAIAPCKLIADQIGALYQCSPVDHYVQIRTPYIYPDGDVIDLYFAEDANRLILSDLGETLRWLDMQTTSPRRSKKQLRLIEDVCATLDIEFVNGSLQVSLGNPDDMARAVTRLAEASVRVSDVWFTFQAKGFASFPEEVEEFLTDKKFPFERDQRIAGKSGSLWLVDFKVLRPTRESYVYALSTGSKSGAKRLTEHVFTAFSDLELLRERGAQFVSLFDDSADVWTGEEMKLVEEVSAVRLWSQQSELRELLDAA